MPILKLILIFSLFIIGGGLGLVFFLFVRLLVAFFVLITTTAVGERAQPLPICCMALGPTCGGIQGPDGVDSGEGVYLSGKIFLLSREDQHLDVF